MSEYAKVVLTDYFQQATENFDADCVTEIGAVVDGIIETAVFNTITSNFIIHCVRRIDELEERVAILEAKNEDLRFGRLDGEF